MSDTAKGTETLQRIMRAVASLPEIRAAYLGGAPLAADNDPFPEWELWLVGEPAVAGRLRDWPGLPENPACLTENPEGCVLVTADGVTVTLHLAPEVVALPLGLSEIFNRTAYLPAGAGQRAPERDLPGETARFWHGIFRAAAAIGREQPFTAHGELESCRTALVGLYRTALAPESPPAGWVGAEAVPGARKVLDGLTEWLVVPLDLRAQYRCACRLAAAYESLMLPLTERLGLAYPFGMRNLAFQRLDQVKRLKEEAPGAPASATPTAAPLDAAEPPKGPVKFRFRRRDSSS